MKITNTVGDVVISGLCTSCGLCVGSCPKNAISFIYGKERNVPTIDSHICINCGMCYAVCPGKGVNLIALGNELFGKQENVKNDICIGQYLETFTGHSTDEDIRYHSATGGMVTQFLIYLLQNKIINGAVTVKYKNNNVFEPEPFIAVNKEDVLESRSSKYVVVSMDKVAKQIIHGNYERLVVVGLPCQIHGWRQLAKINKKIRDSIIGYFAIYCSVNKTKHSMDYYINRYNIKKEQVDRFSFRDDGCMGFMKFTGKKGETLKKIPYVSYWFGTHSFFTNNRCSLCIDQLGELADLSFGDIHVKPYSEDIIGTNSIISRSFFWNEMLKRCFYEGHILLEEVDKETLIKSQIYTRIFKKGAGVKANMQIRKLFHMKNPIYDYSYQGIITPNVVFGELIKLLMRKIGSYKKLWFLVKLMDKNKD